MTYWDLNWYFNPLTSQDDYELLFQRAEALGYKGVSLTFYQKEHFHLGNVPKPRTVGIDRVLAERRARQEMTNSETARKKQLFQRGQLEFTTRLAIYLDTMEKAQMLSLNTQSFEFDLISVEPQSDKLFQQACQHLDVDIITISCSEYALPFQLKFPMISLAISRGIYFEVEYGPFISSEDKSVQMANLLNLYRYTRGKNLILTSGMRIPEKINRSTLPTLLRHPNDIECFVSMFGMSIESARDTISTHCLNVINHSQTRRTHKTVIDVMPIGKINRINELWASDFVGVRPSPSTTSSSSNDEVSEPEKKRQCVQRE